MTQELQRAFTEVSKLPDEEQVRMASWILSELHSEMRWDELFAGSPDTLAMLAQEGLDDRSAQGV